MGEANQRQQQPMRQQGPSPEPRVPQIGDCMLYTYDKDDHPSLVGKVRPCVVLGFSDYPEPEKMGYDVHVLTKGKIDFVDYGWDSSAGPLIKSFVFVGDGPGKMQFRPR